MTTLVRRYTGQADALIARETDPWIQDTETGEPVNLEELDAGLFPAGIFAPVNSAFGIQKDDRSDIFPGDFEAAEALAAHLTTITGRAYEVWYERHENEGASA